MVFDGHSADYDDAEKSGYPERQDGGKVRKWKKGHIISLHVPKCA